MILGSAVNYPARAIDGGPPAHHRGWALDGGGGAPFQGHCDWAGGPSAPLLSGRRGTKMQLASRPLDPAALSMPNPVPPMPSRTGRGPRPIGECAPVAALARKAHRLDMLDRALRQPLAAPLRDQVRFADVRGNRLIFLATSPAWASRLRMLQGQILAAAQAIGVEAAGIIVKVAPLPLPPQEPDRSKPLSASSGAHLKAAAAGIADPELKALFLSLAEVASAGGGGKPGKY
jgi:hypothetical protein